jgi:hypothetical protein
MSGIFNQLMTQEAEKQKQAIQKVKEHSDTESSSDATASQQDSTTSQITKETSPAKQKAQTKATIAVTILDEKLMAEIVAELSRAEVLPNAISIRMTGEEKQYVDDFILDTLRREKLQGPEVSIAKLMRYSLTYLLLNHQKEFIEVLKKTLIKKDSGRLFQ